MKSNVLFILKRRPDFNPIKHSPKGMSTGLFNSANFMNLMLNDIGIKSNIEVAVDNNDIDKMVKLYRPTHVIIEALWVVPSKFAVLTQLHPTVKWIIRLHSEMPFIASEGIAMDWLGDYLTYPQISIAINAPRMLEEIKTYLSTVHNMDDGDVNERIFYLPNYYPQSYGHRTHNRDKDYIDVACFGAVRPLKNHVLQAHAALKAAKMLDKKLRFHINTGRIEMRAEPIMNNLRGMFQQLADSGHQMICHEWVPREGFLEICRQMDVGLQCNFSETFNIVSADLISQGVPIVGSVEIPWSHWLFNAEPAFSDSICNTLIRAYKHPRLNVWLNQKKLDKYVAETRNIWRAYFGGKR
jgi:hypothetical protein